MGRGLCSHIIHSLSLVFHTNGNYSAIFGVDDFACSPVAKVLYKNYRIVIFGQEKNVLLSAGLRIALDRRTPI